MKNLLKTTGLILAFIVISGCADDQYAIEKRYWHLRKRAENILQNPHGAPPAQFQNVILGLKEFMEAYPQLPQSIDAEFLAAKLYLAAGAYGKGRSALEELIVKFPSSQALCSEITYLIGTSYEKEKDWPKALEYYEKVISSYPDSREGMMLPMYIAQYYKRTLDDLKRQDAYRRAISHYRAITTANLGTATAFKADMLTAKAYAEIEDWKNALQILEMTIYEYKDTMNVEGALINKVLIYSRQLHDEIKAREALMELAEFYSESKFLKLSEQQIALKEFQTE